MSKTLFDKEAPHCQFWLATTVPQMLYCRRWADYDRVGMKRDDELQTDESYKAGFIDSWGIDTREDWHAMIHRLSLGEVHGDTWQHLFSRRACSTPSQWLTFIENQEGNPIAQGELRYIDVVYRQVGHIGFLAWDYVRGTFLTRAGYQVGVVTEEECAFLLNHFAQLIQRSFHGWNQYIASFILGRAYWVYSSSDEEEQENQLAALLNTGLGKTFDDYFTLLHNDQDVPIAHIDWDTPLPSLPVPESLQHVLAQIQNNDQPADAQDSQE